VRIGLCASAAALVLSPLCSLFAVYEALDAKTRKQEACIVLRLPRNPRRNMPEPPIITSDSTSLGLETMVGHCAVRHYTLCLKIEQNYSHWTIQHKSYLIKIIQII